MRKIPFIKNGYYHVYNRGVDKRTVFQRFGHYARFVNTIRSILKTGSATQRLIYNQGLALSTNVHILAYCLMPNHYHFLFKQTGDFGISEFMHKLDTSYTMYFNRNNNRTGRLFEQTFKAKIIDTDEALLHVSRYIHLNPVLAHLIDHPIEWRWSSYQEYFKPDISPICNHTHILDHFQSSDRYRAFVEDTDARTLLLRETLFEKNQDEDSLFL